MSADTTLMVMGEELLLVPERAIFWIQQQVLIVADVHLGKVGHFRKAGIAVPQQIGHEDLACLTRLINRLQPQKIWFLGDLFHSDMNADWQHFANWRRQYPDIVMQLVIGNHDIIKQQHYHDIDISTHHELIEGPFVMLHHPQNDECLKERGKYVFCGHIHPGVTLVGKGRQSVTLPCFAFGERQAVLPSFGKFTGRVSMLHRQNDRVFGILKEKVFEV